MQKDVIYIDVEDDITAIIGKVKSAKEKIVALVPPKRIGVLQSAVNLRLIERAASLADKRLVIITNNDALQSLAASAKIPVAKNLQSKPELAEIAALDVDDGDDIIDGAQLPIGDHASQGEGIVVGSAAAADVISDDPKPSVNRLAPIANTSTATKNIARSRVKVPNFGNFRKKLLIGGTAGALLLGFLIWAIFFAASATVLITAKTTDASVNDAITLSTSAATDPEKKVIRSSTQSSKKDVSIEFVATGKKDVGEKATGTVRFSTDSLSVITSGRGNIAAGTRLTSSSGSTYTTDSAVNLTVSAPTGSTSITATANGASYNGASGAVSGAPSGVNATITGTTAGGTDKTITVVTASDIQTAKDQLNHQNTDDVKKQLAAQFDKNTVVLDATFKADIAAVNANPAEGAEASSGKATLAGSVNYTMVGVAKSEIGSYLDGHFKVQLVDNREQRVYDNGASKVSFTNVNAGDSAVTTNLTAVGKIGPKIEDSVIKDMAKGKKYGEIQSAVQDIQGVSSVDIKFAPFWVNSAPSNPDRITIKFNLDDKN